MATWGLWRRSRERTEREFFKQFMLRNFPLLFWGIFRGWRSIAAGDLELGFAAAARWPRHRAAQQPAAASERDASRVVVSGVSTPSETSARPILLPTFWRWTGLLCLIGPGFDGEGLVRPTSDITAQMFPPSHNIYTSKTLYSNQCSPLFFVKKI